MHQDQAGVASRQARIFALSVTGLLAHMTLGTSARFPSICSDVTSTTLIQFFTVPMTSDCEKSIVVRVHVISQRSRVCVSVTFESFVMSLHVEFCDIKHSCGCSHGLQKTHVLEAVGNSGSVFSLLSSSHALVARKLGQFVIRAWF